MKSYPKNSKWFFLLFGFTRDFTAQNESITMSLILGIKSL
jgi:hypothetical protein